MSKNAIKRREARQRRKRSIRKKINGTNERPRLSVFRSARHIYVQVVDDGSGHTLASASTMDPKLRGVGAEEGDAMNKTDIAKLVGKMVAERCIEKNIKKVVFDRNGFIYHGRLKSLAEGAREGGLDF